MGQASPSTRVSLLARLREPADQDAWSAFVARYGPQVYGWCRAWGLQEADARDVSQNVLARLVEKMRGFRYDPSGSFRAWLKAVTRNAWHDYAAQRRRPGAGTGDSAVERLLGEVQAGDDLAAHLRQQFDQEVLEEARLRVQARVEAPTWEAFRLTALDNVAGAEAAERLGMTVATVYKAKSRVVKMLQEEVRRLEGEAP